ncbi:MAG: bifunctional (p)ppGpp synthetase/guanosine-3',5'-bis(diphosphate) 3'-pyrophosphohydrolase [Deltaproteobacteria bacterium]|nr:bifunctional (p)ppGpp synthetase/guanosine-3',5'-bis(diphosphate) 3'-pyrophosphohydrolase [Deltaproteobacteria bacterium]
MWNPDRYKEALTFAATRHGDQREPGHGLPYVVHLCKVAMEVQRAAVDDASFDVDLAVTAALLHDVVEDTATTRGEVASHFGDAVAKAVAALTKDASLPKEQRMLDSLARIRAEPKAVWVVKVADRITNLEEPPSSWSIDKRRAYHAEAATIRDHLRGALASLEARFEHKIAAYARWCG